MEQEESGVAATDTAGGAAQQSAVQLGIPVHPPIIPIAAAAFPRVLMEQAWPRDMGAPESVDSRHQCSLFLWLEGEAEPGAVNRNSGEPGHWPGGVQGGKPLSGPGTHCTQ